MRALALSFLLLSGCGRIIHLFDREVDLRVLETSQTKRLVAGTTFDTEEGERFLLAEVRVENTTKHEKFPAPFTAFTLVKDDDKSVGAEPLSAALEEGSDGEETLREGGETTCWLAFAFDEDDEPVKLQFTTPENREGEAKISVDDCEWCGLDCVDLLTDPDNCGQCGARVDADQECMGGQRVCMEVGESLCGDGCVDILSDREHCGACDDPVPQGYECVDGEPQCPSSTPGECADGCHDFSSEDDNCGGCDQDCGVGDCVRAGRCEELEYTSSSDDALCSDLCADIGYDCSYGNVHYSTYYAYECEDQRVDCDEHADPDAGGYTCFIDSIYCNCYLQF